MLYTGNPVILEPGMVFFMHMILMDYGLIMVSMEGYCYYNYFMHMILMDSENKLSMNLGKTYLVTNSGNQRMGKKKLDLVIK